MLISQLSKALIAAPLLLITAKAGSQQDLDYASVYSEESLVTASDASVAHKMVLNKHVASYVKNYIKKNSDNLEEIKKKIRLLSTQWTGREKRNSNEDSVHSKVGNSGWRISKCGEGSHI